MSTFQEIWGFGCQQFKDRIDVYVFTFHEFVSILFIVKQDPVIPNEISVIDLIGFKYIN